MCSIYNNKVTHSLTTFLKLKIIILLLPLLLIGCGGGSGSDNNTNSTQGSTINAMYSKGPVDGAIATLLDADGNVVAGPVMTVDGSASFTNVTYNGPVYASFAGGSYTDEATGATVVLDANFVIRSGVINNSGSGTLDIVATPLTEIAFLRAEDAAVGSLDLSTVNTFMDMVADEFGLDGINLTEVIPTPLADITGTSDSDLYGAVLAGITQQQLTAGAATDSAALLSYITDNVTGLDAGAYTAAVNELLNNALTKISISNITTSAIINAVGIDATAPILSAVSATPATTSVALQFTSDEAGTAYFLTQIGGSVPTAAQVKSGSGNGGTVNGANSAVASSGANNVNLTGLTQGTAYTIYVIVEDTIGNQSSVASTAATTTVPPDITAPVLSSISATPAPTSVALQFSSDEAGTAYFLAQTGGGIPTAAQVKSGSGNGGTVNGAESSAASSGINNVNLSGLSQGTAYIAYVIVEDVSGNQSSVASKAATTTVAADTTAPTINILTNTFNATAISAIFSSDEVADTYYLLQQGGSAPSAGQIINGSGNGGTVVDSGIKATLVGSNFINFTDLTENTAYTVYLVAEDVVGNQSLIESQAVSTSDVTAPVLSSVSATESVFTVDLQFTSDEAGIIYYLAQQGGSAPTGSFIKSGTGNGATAVGAGNSAVSVGVNTATLINLSASAAYTIYFMQEDSQFNQSAVGSISVNTLADTKSPILSAVSASAADTTAVLLFTTDEPGTAYFLAQQGGSVPSSAQVKSGNGNGGAIAGVGSSAASLGGNTANLSGLSLLTDYTLYIVVEDVSANISNIASASASTSDDVTAPQAVITFPPAHSIIEAESSITVHGTTTDLNTITSVQVNGVPVTTSDNFATWVVSVPLTTGINTLQVSTADSVPNSNNNVAEAEIDSIAVSLVNPLGMIIDIPRDRVLIIDQKIKALVAVDLTSGVKSIISSATRGTGVDFNSPIRLDVDVNSQHAYVLDSNRIIDVDLDTGNRSVLSDVNNGTGPQLSSAKDLTLDATNGILFVLSRVSVLINGVTTLIDSIVEVDIVSGNRNAFDPTNSGSAFRVSALPKGILFTGSELLTSHFSGQDGAILAVNVGTGVKRTVSTNGFGFGVSMPRVENMAAYSGGSYIIAPHVLEVKSNGDREDFSHPSFPATRLIRWGAPTDIATDKLANDRFIVVDSTRDAVVGVEYDGFFQFGRGAQTMISEDSIGSGTFLQGPNSMVVDSNNNQLIIADIGDTGITNDKIFIMDINTSNRSKLSGDGPLFSTIDDLALDGINNRVYVLQDFRIQAVFEVDLVSGDRTVITNAAERDGIATKGSGLLFSPVNSCCAATAKSLVADIEHDRILVSAPSPKAIIAVDLATGNRTVFSQFSSGTGVGVDTTPVHMVLDKSSNRILGVDNLLGAVVAIDLISGDRSIISDINTGTGVDLGSPSKISLDSKNNQVVVRSGSSLIEVDLSNGNRTLVSNGIGAALASPVGIAIDSQNNRLYVGDSIRDAVFAVEIDSGDRVIIAK